MKKLLLAFVFIGFLVTSSFATTASISSSFGVEFCDDDKCDKKDCDKKSCKKGDKKASKDKSKKCSKGKTADTEKK
jgi:hypothetical protein